MKRHIINRVKTVGTEDYKFKIGYSSVQPEVLLLRNSSDAEIKCNRLQVGAIIIDNNNRS